MKLKLCNVHKLSLSNEGEGRKPIHIPFGTWAYDDTLDQTLDREHAEAIAADLAGKIAAGEPGIPVYQGHPDVPEYAGKYPDKGALGWVKKILVNEDGMDLEVEWDRDPGKGFGWFSPYWVGDTPTAGANGKRNCIIDGLNSIGLVNNPNIREFRLANEAQPEERKPMKTYELPEHIAALAKKFDERRAMANVVDANGMGHGDDGRFDGSGSGGGGGGGGNKPFHTSDGGGFMRSTERIAEEGAQKAIRAKGAVKNPATRAERARSINDDLAFHRNEVKGKGASNDFEWREAGYNSVRATHRAAIYLGLKYNRATHQYE